MDGLPGMKRGLAAAKTYNVPPLKKMVGPLAPTRYHSGLGFSTLQVLIIALLMFFLGLATALYGREALDIVTETVKGSPLELHVGNLTQRATQEGISGIWATQ
jgi:hypothetical protein